MNDVEALLLSEITARAERAVETAQRSVDDARQAVANLRAFINGPCAGAPERQVYFIQAGRDSSGLIKIGVSIDPADRLRRMQTGSPAPLRLIASFGPATYADESRLHAELAAHRIDGEWFAPHQEVFDVIARVCA